MSLKRLYILFAPAFHEVPLALGRRLQATDPGTEIAGLVTGSRIVYDRVARHHEPEVRPLDWLDALERGWLERGDEDDRLRRLEERVSKPAIKEIVVADRQVGGGFVSDGLLMPSPLSKLSRDTRNVRRYVAGLLEYALGQLEKFRPDVVFCYTVAGAPARALAVASELHGIPFARISSTHLRRRYAIESGPRLTLSAAASLHLQQQSGEHAVDRFKPEALELVRSFRTRPAKYDASAGVHAREIDAMSVAGMVSTGKRYLLASISTLRRPELADLRHPAPWRTGVLKLKQSLRARQLLGRHGPFEQSGRLPTRDFAYLPLQVSPEASTMVLAPMYTDQAAVAEAIAKALPLGMDLLIKEHIPMLGRRPAGFYQRLARMPGVRLASPLDDGFEIIKRSSLTCSITGTSAFEAMLLGRPALVVGRPHFVDAGEGIVCCTDFTRLSEAIGDALSSPPASEETLVSYVAALLAVSFDLPRELYGPGVIQNDAESRPDAINAILLGLSRAADLQLERSEMLSLVASC